MSGRGTRSRLGSLRPSRVQRPQPPTDPDNPPENAPDNIPVPEETPINAPNIDDFDMDVNTPPTTSPQTTGSSPATSSLSSTPAHKPKFQVNIPQTRKRPVVEAPETKPVELADDGTYDRRRGRGRGRGAGRGRGHVEMITAAGAFGAGPMASVGSSSSQFGGKSMMFTADDEDSLKDEFDDDDIAFDPMDALAPVRMGGTKSGSSRSALVAGVRKGTARAKKEKEKVEAKIKVKHEYDEVTETAPEDDDEDEMETAAMDMDLPNYDVAPGEFFGDQPNRLLFFSFPSTMPKFPTPLSSDDIQLLEPEPKPKPEVKDEDTPTTAAPAVSSAEGRVGKLFVYKSGRVVLKMGTVGFDVTTSLPGEFYQEVVTVKSGGEEAVVLGDLKRRYVCIPDVDSLLAA